MRLPAITALGLLPLLAACGSSGTTDSGTPTATLTVSAAASLTDAFTEIGERYAEEHPGTEVRFNFAGSSTLVEQVNSGAPVDVLATASDATMQSAVGAGSVTDPVLFAANSLAIAVPAGNPAGIRSLADLADPDVTVVLCAPQVPCGAAADDLLTANGLDITPASLEPDVRAVLTKVTADEVDAGLVYRTDLVAAGSAVEGIAIPDAANVVTAYPIAVTDQGAPEAQDFVDLVLSDEGQGILERWGFTA